MHVRGITHHCYYHCHHNFTTSTPPLDAAQAICSVQTSPGTRAVPRAPLAPWPVTVNDAIEFCSLGRSDIVLSKQEAVAKRAKSLITTSEQ
ncbi:hypothetical protein HYQ45_012014 [Verticillium longisporum]|uniref:Uncharacterized protein n=1 Tax=Verticillium longisporum TaxID=100787 RepID=A0A8I2ZEP7_VERLO|nr:hypothetical protein HYQ45_012014 [Verticillium longisporum]